MNDDATLGSLRANLPHFSCRYHHSGAFLYGLIRAYSLHRCLDAGLRRGLMTAYISAAVNALGGEQVLALGQNSHRQQATLTLSYLAKAGLDRYLKVTYHAKAVSALFLESFLAEPNRKFDLVHAHYGPDVQSMALIACLAARVLAPGGWFVFDSRVPPAKKQEDERVPDSGSSLNTAPSMIFRTLVGMNHGFCLFRQEGYFFLAQKSPEHGTYEMEEVNRNALLLGEALAQATEDLPFRLALTNEPTGTLYELSRIANLATHSVGFLEGYADILTGLEQVRDSPLLYRLAETPWERRGRLESERRI